MDCRNEAFRCRGWPHRRAALRCANSPPWLRPPRSGGVYAGWLWSLNADSADADNRTDGPNFGLIPIRQNNIPRQIQLGFKLSFNAAVAWSKGYERETVYAQHGFLMK